MARSSRGGGGSIAGEQTRSPAGTLVGSRRWSAEWEGNGKRFKTLVHEHGAGVASGFWALFVLSEGETSRVRVVALRRRAAAAKAVASAHLGRSPVLKACQTREVSHLRIVRYENSESQPSFLNNW